MNNVLIIDDDSAFREALAETLTDLSFDVAKAGSVAEALALLKHATFYAILIDYNMPHVNGIDGIALIRSEANAHFTPIVMITSYLDADTTVRAMAQGAFDYLTKPVSIRQIESVFERIREQFGDEGAQETPQTSNNQKSTFVCASAAMRDVLKVVGRIASADVNVLIKGETGTGKEMIAQMIHTYSPRRNSPFVPINCAAIPPDLLESELFGHTRGAFTGAVSDREGAFARAQDGTLFLDEIGDMPFTLQAKLLRVLQEREVTPVGGSKTIKIRARFISATHQSLDQRVEEGLFRQDLIFRLNGVEIALPPLRERKEDIPALALNFLKSFGGKKFSPTAMALLENYAWPGNVRELKNVVERAAHLTSGQTIGPASLGSLSTPLPAISIDASVSTAAPQKTIGEAISDLERNMILNALKNSQNNKAEAARILGIARQQLYVKMKQLGIEA